MQFAYMAIIFDCCRSVENLMSIQAVAVCVCVFDTLCWLRHRK